MRVGGGAARAGGSGSDASGDVSSSKSDDDTQKTAEKPAGSSDKTAPPIGGEARPFGADLPAVGADTPSAAPAQETENAEGADTPPAGESKETGHKAQAESEPVTANSLKAMLLRAPFERNMDKILETVDAPLAVINMLQANTHQFLKRAEEQVPGILEKGSEKPDDKKAGEGEGPAPEVVRATQKIAENDARITEGLKNIEAKIDQIQDMKTDLARFEREQIVNLAKLNGSDPINPAQSGEDGAVEPRNIEKEMDELAGEARFMVAEVIGHFNQLSMDAHEILELTDSDFPLSPGEAESRTEQGERKLFAMDQNTVDKLNGKTPEQARADMLRFLAASN